jgi:hypothetical protein
LLFGSDVHPTALTAEIAAVDDGNVEIRGKKLATLQPSLVQPHGPQPFDPHVPKQFPQFGKSKIHEVSSGR